MLPVEQVRTDDVAQGQRAMPLHQGGDGCHQLRQGGAQSHKGQRDDGFRHTQRLGDQGAVIHQQIRAKGDGSCTQYQLDDVHQDGGFLLLFRRSGVSRQFLYSLSRWGSS